MQKNKLKASILLWSIFLSMIVIVIFIGASSKIHKILIENREIKLNIDSNKKIKTIINNGILTGNFTNTDTGNNERIEFNNQKTIDFGIKKGKNKEIKFSIDSIISIEILTGSSIFYTLSGTTTSSGIINTITTINTGSGFLNIKSLGGYSQIKIDSNNNFLTKYTTYKILKKIGNKEVIKTKGTIINF